VKSINSGNILANLIVGLIALAAGYLIRKYIAEAKIQSAEESAKKIIEDAENKAESIKRESVIEAKEEILKLKNEAEKEQRERRNELQRTERRLIQKEEALDRKLESIEKKEEAISKKQNEINQLHEKINDLYSQQIAELERISALTTDEAKELLLNKVKDEIRHDAAIMIKEIESQAKEEAQKRAREIISCAIQKCAADHVA
jgi:ribonuclease Y